MQDGHPIGDQTARIMGATFEGAIIHPVHIYFNRHPYSLIVDYTVPIHEVRSRISGAIGGGVPADQPHVLWEWAELDNDMTLTGMEYVPQSQRLEVEEAGN
jgi:hypothetical protein